MSSTPHHDPLTWIVQTKVQPPHASADVIERPRLLAALARAVPTHRLTLVSAPAGYGKTTLLTALPQACRDLALGWLALDTDDDDPAHFLAGLIAALRRVKPDFGATTLALLTNLTDPATEMRRLIGVLINDLIAANDAPIAVVLDDLHLISAPAIYLGLDYLIERLPPQVHLAIATRHDPPLALARLRARRQLAELRLADLRFTPAEMGQFLNGLFATTVTGEQLRSLDARTEGWAAGMSLIAGALRQIDADAGRATFLAEVAASDRHIADYLTEEVWRGEDQATQAFLLDTAILDDLTPANCATVADRADAAAILQTIRRRNLFVLTLDPAGETLRYHTFFRDFLRRRLAEEDSGERRRVLHRRAATIEADRTRAIGHLLAAEAWDEAAAAIGDIGAELLASGGRETLRHWLTLLPASVAQGYPRLALLNGIAAWDRWDVLGAREALTEARNGFIARNDPAGRGETEVYLASALVALAEHDSAAGLLATAVTAPLPPAARVQLLLNRAWQGQQTGDPQGANAALDEALTIAEATNDRRTLRIIATQLQGEFVPLPGGPARIARLGRLVERHLADQESPLRASIAAARTWQHLWRGEWEAARESGEHALAINRKFGGSEQPTLDVITVTISLALARWHTFRGQSEAGERYLTALFGGPPGTVLGQPITPIWATSILYPLARVRLVQERYAEARAIYAQLAEPLEQERPDAAIVRAMLRGFLALADRKDEEAIAAFTAAAEGQRRLLAARFYGLAELPLSSAYLAAGRTTAALATLQTTLHEYRSNQTPGALLWEDQALLTPLLKLAIAHDVEAPFAAELLTTLGTPNTGAATSPPASFFVPQTGATLTPREVEVLRLLMRDADNLTIADELFISIHTVKRHVANLLAKLDVTSRTQAVNRAHELGLS
ncbi:MAG TPA: LuxR C-terminal-related transcriptional regulator [Thermomicrobiales bacterium]|jgi:LuxR family maltose regulon positive regulatory protein